MTATSQSPFVTAVSALAPQIDACVEESERTRRLAPSLVEALAHAGLFRLLVPRAIGGEEIDPLTFVEVIEAVSRVDGATGWCVMIGGCYGAFGGYLPPDAAREIFGSGASAIIGGAFRAAGQAVPVADGYRITGRWTFASGCQHCTRLIAGCRVLEGDRPRLNPGGTPLTRILFLPAADCTIIDTWRTAGLRGTGSHDFAAVDLFVPAAHSLSFREPPAQRGPLYALPTLALFASAVAAVPLGIARHAIDLFTNLASVKVGTRSRQTLNLQPMLQADLGRAEALLRSARAFLYETLGEAWRRASAGETLGITERAMLWLAATQANAAAAQAVDLMFTAGGSASVYASAGLERCVRDIRTAGQHISLVPSNFQMVGQALLGMDMRESILLALDDRDPK